MRSPTLRRIFWNAFRTPSSPMGQCLFPVNIAYATRIAGVGLAQATYDFDPITFAQDEGSRQMRYRPTVDRDFSLLVMLHQEARIDTFKYHGSELICEACGPDFLIAMIHTTAGGLAPDQPWSIKIEPAN